MAAFASLPKGRKTLASSHSLCLSKIDIFGYWCYSHLSAFYFYVLFFFFFLFHLELSCFLSECLLPTQQVKVKEAFKQLAVVASLGGRMMNVIVAGSPTCRERGILTVEQTNRNGQMSPVLGQPHPGRQASILGSSTELHRLHLCKCLRLFIFFLGPLDHWVRVGCK